MRTSLLGWCVMLLAACSTDTFEGGDGGNDAANDAVVSDVGASDGTSGGDAVAVDAGKPDATVSFSCNPARAGSLLCDTFDNVSNVTDMWTTSLVNATGKVALDTSSSTSSPKSYSSELQQGSDQYTFAILFFEDTSASYTTMSARASVRIHAIDSAQPVPLVQLSYQSSIGSGKVTATLGAVSGAFVVVYSQPSIDAGIVTSPGVTVGLHKLDTWHTVQLDMKQGPTAMIRTYIDGVLVSTLTPTLNAPQSKIRDFEVGIAGNNGTDMLVNYDDVDCAGF